MRGKRSLQNCGRRTDGGNPLPETLNFAAGEDSCFEKIPFSVTKRSPASYV